MEKIQITCDSTCDLTDELYTKYGVEVIPLSIGLGDEDHKDGVDVTPEELFAYTRKTSSIPKTGAVSPDSYAQVFEKYVSQGYKVIHISLSSGLSSTHQNAVLAASELEGVYVIDSMNLSSGSGHLVLMAGELREEGKSAAEIADILNEAKTRLDVSFVLQTLEFMKIGGRCSSVAALGANLLKILPQIVVRDGKMTVGQKFRGSIQKSTQDYVRTMLEGRTDLDLHRIFVTHSGMAKEVVDSLIALVKELQPFEEVLETRAGCTISSHCGPDCVGVLFFTKK